MDARVDQFFLATSAWREELLVLRHILLDCPIEEVLKWRQPCYTFGGKNLFILGGFKNYCALAFFNGALLSDEAGLLISPGKNTQAGRQLRFTTVDEIHDLKATIKAYIYEAIDLQRQGIEVVFAKGPPTDMPEELLAAFIEQAALKSAFDALTPGRQRAYVNYFSQAKRSSTRRDRVERMSQRILDGYGLLDCTCGLSKQMPSCDGSHRAQKD